MFRVTIPALVLAAAACGAETPPIQAASDSPPLFRGAGSEVRLRCGSESLRARLRQGQIVAQTDAGETAVLAPVDDPRAQSGPAYSDGKLTLYKVPRADNWALARSGSAGSACTREAPGQGTGKDAIPAR